MAVSNNVNRITLKIGVVFNETDALKQAKKLQGSLDKQSETMNKKREKGINAVTNAQKKNNSTIKEGSKATKSLGQNFADAFKKAVKGFVVLQLLLAITTQIRRSVQLAIQLDSAFTNLAIVSGASASEIAQVNSQVDELTTTLGKLKSEIIDTVTEFKRAGFTIQESLELASVAIIGANVGFTSLANVTDFIIAGLKAFNLEASESTMILDTLFSVANRTPISLEGLGEAFLRSANVLKNSGATIQESAALISAANSTVLNPTKVGTALATISSRLRGVGVEGEAIPKLAKDFKNVGIEIQNADGSFRDIFSIFEEFANIYDELDEITRESLLEKVAGKRQKNVLISLLNNFDTAKQAVKDASESAGESARAQEEFLKSLQGQATLLKNAWNSLLETLRDSGALEVVIKALTGISKALAFIVKEIPLVIAGISGLTLQFVAFGAKAGTAIGFATGGISILVGLLAVVAQGYASFGNQVEKTNVKIADTKQRIQELRGEISLLETSEQDLSEGQKTRLKSLERQLEIEERLLKINEIKRAKQDNKAVKKSIEEINEAIENQIKDQELLDSSRRLSNRELESIEKSRKGRIETLLAEESALLQLKSTLDQSLEVLDESDEQYKINIKTLEDVEGALTVVTSAYGDLFGIIEEVADETEEKATPAITGLRKALQDAKDQVGVANDDFRLLVDSFLDLEESGYLSAEALDALLIAYPDLIEATDLTVDGLREFIAAQNESTISTLEKTKKSLEAELDFSTSFIETTKNRIEAIKAEQDARTGLAGVIARIAGDKAIQALDIALGNQEKNVLDALNQIARIENEIAGLRAKTNEALNPPDSGGGDGGSSKQTKVLTALERALNEVNFQIERQQKLLSRTDIPSEQIKINETLIDLYKQQKQVLVEQQAELESQRSQVVKGTEAYDDFIEKSYDLSLAIEDSTNNIYALEQANRELNKTFQETKLGELEESLSSLSDSIKDTLDEEIAKVKELAEVEADRFKSLIESKKAELQALKDANSEKEDQIKLEQLLLNLQDLRERRQNILNNKNVRIVRDADVGFENIADPRELRAVGEQIIDAEQAIADFRREQVFNEEVKKLELTIEGLEKQAKAEQESYDERVRVLEEFKNDTDELVESGAQVQRTVITNLANDLENIEKGSYTSRLQGLNSFISEYNAKLSQLNVQRARVEAVEQSIRNAQQNIQSLQSSPTLNSASTGSTTSATLSTGNLANNISSNNINTTNSSTNIGNINVNTNANSLDNLIKDARRQTPLLSKN